jgi:hypothetical protein
MDVERRGSIHVQCVHDNRVPLPRERACNVINSFEDRLGTARRAARRIAKGVCMKTEVALHSVAGIVIGKCLAGQAEGFTAREVLDDCPTLAGAYRTANALGTMMGAGVRGKGLGLHRASTERFARCRDNAALAASRLSDDELSALAADLGFADAEALIDAIDRLPVAPSA